MTVSEVVKKYNISKQECWQHKQSGKWILSHESILKIADIEGITFRYTDIWQTENCVRMTCIATSKSGIEVKEIGEASTVNSINKFFGCMAKKRGEDRALLKLIKAYSIYSAEECDEFKK